MELEAIKTEEGKKAKKGRKIVIYILIFIISLFAFWCLAVALWPNYMPTFSTTKYEEPLSGHSESEYFIEDGNDTIPLEEFSIQSHKQEYIHWTSIFSYERQYHYEYSLSLKEESSYTYFLLYSFTLVQEYEGGSFEVSFSPIEENLLSSYSDVVLSEDIDISSGTLSIKRGSEINLITVTQ